MSSLLKGARASRPRLRTASAVLSCASLSPLYFLAASVLALAVATLTVIAQSLSLAHAEPAKALRHE